MPELRVGSGRSNNGMPIQQLLLPELDPKKPQVGGEKNVRIRYGIALLNSGLGRPTAQVRKVRIALTHRPIIDDLERERRDVVSRNEKSPACGAE